MQGKIIIPRWQVDAQNECIDFIYNGYEEVFSVVQHDWWYFKLRHQRNGNVIIMDCKPAEIKIYKCKVLIKHIEYKKTGSFGSFSPVAHR